MSIRLSHATARSLLLPSIALSGSALSASCTLVTDDYEPRLVAPVDAGPLPALAIDAAVPPAAASDPGCAREAAASCSASIGLVEPSPADAGPQPAQPAQPALPALLLPPCTSGFADFGEPQPLLGVEFDEDVYGPALSGDGRTLYFSAYAGGEQQIYAATRETRGVEFSSVTELPVINSPAMDGSPFISAGGERLYFFSERPQGSLGRRDIWVSERGADAFGEPQQVVGINSPSSELLPWLTPDELTVLFVSGRAGGSGGADVWRATRPSVSEPFGAPSLVPDLSSSGNEGRAVLSADGTSAFFTSDRAGGAPDIWAATRATRAAPFGNLRRLAPLNTSATELDVMISKDDRELFFASTRSGKSALYRTERACL
jgi:Tol biopolymer transport system component